LLTKSRPFYGSGGSLLSLGSFGAIDFVGIAPLLVVGAILRPFGRRPRHARIKNQLEAEQPCEPPSFAS
jgi:hypothetical protein